MAKVVEPENLKATMDRLVATVLADADTAREFCEAFDAFLDDLLSDDFFGTEGQLDPRGDRRDD